MPARIAITGASGYIGSLLTAALPADAFSVKILRRDDAGLARMYGPDPDDGQALATALSGVSAVVHLAAMPEADCNANPEAAVLCNALALHRLAGAAVAAGVTRIIYLSTVKVYGPAISGTINEDCALAPIGHYAITKLAGEAYLRSTAAGIDVTTFRLSNMVGTPAGQPPASALTLIANDLCHQAIRTGRIVLRSSGQQWRNWIDAADVVDAIKWSLTRPGHGMGYQTFNLGGRETTTLLDLARRVAEAAGGMRGQTVRIETAPRGPEQPPFFYDCRSLRAAGFSADRNIDTAIADTLRLFAE